MEGYDARFDPPLEKRLECPICLLAQREPMQTPCGHRFCSACILRALRETGPRCPVDNTKTSNHQLFKDNFAKREVLSLKVRCAADEAGCKWKGELRDLEIHTRHCDLVDIECPNTCGHSCQRRYLSPHLLGCPNKPCQCPTCSIHFQRNRVEEHTSHCSRILLPDSIINGLFKANEVLKWCGHLKLKLNNQPMQVTGYLSVKAESEESFIFTGTWSNTLNIIPLNNGASKIFWKMLHGPEVQPMFFNFAVLSNDQKSLTFQKMLKKKFDLLHAAVGLRLKPMNRRDLTLVYFYWSEQRKRLMGCVAELKSYLVRQIQSRLQVLQQNSRNRRNATRSTMRSRQSVLWGEPSRTVRVALSDDHAPPTTVHFPPHQHAPPPPQVRVVNLPPHPHPHPHHQSHLPHPHPYQHPHPHPRIHQHPPPAQVQAPGVNSNSGSPSILPSLLSWQMSQSLNTFPWRMQTAGVPFFTFPSTPPQFIPANSYPYSFAPIPAASLPFSIGPIQPGSSSVPVPVPVPVPPYAGIAVPSGAVGEPPVVTLNSTPSHHAPPFAVSAAAAVAVQQLGEVDVPTVTVTLSANPAAAIANPGTLPLSVIQQHPAAMEQTNPTHAHFVAQDHAHHAHHHAHHAHHHHHHGPAVNMVPPALIPAGLAPPMNPVLVDEIQQVANGYPMHIENQPLAPSRRLQQYYPPSAADLRSARPDDSVRNPLHIAVPQPSEGESPTHTPTSAGNPLSSGNLPAELMSAWDMPGPSSHLQQSGNLPSPSDSESSGSPSTQFPTFSPLSLDSEEAPSTPDLYSPPPVASASSSEGSLALSDQEGGGGGGGDSRGSPTGGNSALHTLADAAAILADFPSDSSVAGESPTEPSPPSSLLRSNAPSDPSVDRPMRLPVLINVPYSDSESVGPPSVIDLTHSPLSRSPPRNSANMRSRSNGTATRTAPHSHPTAIPTPARTNGNNLTPMLLPVIHDTADPHSNPDTTRSSNMGMGPVGPRLQQSHTNEQPGPSSNLAQRRRNTLGIGTRNVPPRPTLQGPFSPPYPGGNVPVLSWPYEHVDGSGTAHHHVLPVASGYAPAAVQPGPVVGGAPGNFWDTVFPSLDLSLQSSSSDGRSS